MAEMAKQQRLAKMAETGNGNKMKAFKNILHATFGVLIQRQSLTPRNKEFHLASSCCFFLLLLLFFLRGFCEVSHAMPI